MKIDLKKYILPNLPYLSIFWFFSKAAESYRLTVGGTVDKAMGALSGLGAVISGSPLPSFHPRDLLAGMFGAVAIWLIVYFRKKNAKKFRHGVEYGSARWGNADDIKPFIDPKFDQNILLTQTERIMLGRNKIPKYNINKNVLVIGGSGSGKTRFHVKPNLMQQNCSYLVTDPKGLVFRGRRNPHKTKENLRVCRRWHYDRTSNRNHRIVCGCYNRDKAREA